MEIKNVLALLILNVKNVQKKEIHVFLAIMKEVFIHYIMMVFLII